jgi:hypothetical protein
MANNKFMDITKWKKIVARAKRADKNLEKVSNWSVEHKDYDDGVSVMDAWEWGTCWIDDWYDTVVENGLYDLNGKKIHILYKSPKVHVDDGNIFGHDEIINGLNRFGFNDVEYLQIDYSYSDFRVEEIEWIVVAVVDGIKTLIIPYKKGDYNPKDDFWHDWYELARDDDNCFDNDDLVGESQVSVHDTVEWYGDKKNVEYLSYYKREYDNYNSGYNISWSNMRRIA